MAQTITAQVGGEAQERWLAESVAIVAGTLSPPVSQAADLWGRKWFVVGFTVCGAVGCLIVSRAQNFGTLIGGQCECRVSYVEVYADGIQQSGRFTREPNASSTLLLLRSCHVNGVPLLKRQRQPREV